MAPLAVNLASGLAVASWMIYRYPRIVVPVVKYAGAIGGVVIALTASGLWYYQSMMMYPASYPDGSRSDVPDPYDLFGIPYKNLNLPTPDGETLAAYLIYARPAFEAKSILALSTSKKIAKKGDEKVEVSEKESEGKLSKDGEDFVKSRPTVIMFHANAGNMGHRLPLARAFWEGIECNVFMLSYRGYGRSTGSPSEKGLRIDAQTALDYVKKHPLLKDTKVVIYGQSIGGCVSIALAGASSDRLDGMIIENSPLSMRSLVPLVMPWLTPFLYIPTLLHQKWDANISIPLIRKDLPILALAGEKDEIVIPTQMTGIKALRENAGGKLTWKSFANGTHNDTYAQPGYWQAIKDFIEKEVGAKSSKASFNV